MSGPREAESEEAAIVAETVREHYGFAQEEYHVPHERIAVFDRYATDHPGFQGKIAVVLDGMGGALTVALGDNPPSTDRAV